MKQTLKLFICISISSLAILNIVSCKKWVTPESLNIESSNIQTTNNELYQQYLKELRDYKKSDHQIIVGWFDNSIKTVNSRGYHLEAVPDQVDMLILIAPDSLKDIDIKEMKTIQQDKGTKVLYSIDYEAIEKTYRKDSLGEIGKAISYEKISVEHYITYLLKELDKQIILLDKYGYDGINLCYVGFSSVFIDPTDVVKITQIQVALFERMVLLAQESGKLLLFEGHPENVYDKTKLDLFKVISIKAFDATGVEGLDFALGSVALDGVPVEKLIPIVEPYSLDEDDIKTGVFLSTSGEKLSAIVETAHWTTSLGSFKKAGFGIYKINNDYFNVQKDYLFVKEAIDIIKPIN